MLVLDRRAQDRDRLAATTAGLAEALHGAALRRRRGPTHPARTRTTPRAGGPGRWRRCPRACAPQPGTADLPSSRGHDRPHDDGARCGPAARRRGRHVGRVGRWGSRPETWTGSRGRSQWPPGGSDPRGVRASRPPVPADGRGRRRCAAGDSARAAAAPGRPSAPATRPRRGTPRLAQVRRRWPPTRPWPTGRTRRPHGFAPESEGVGPPRQRPGVADLVGGHHEDVERRSQGAPGPPPGGRGGEAPGRSSGPVGRRPARCRWKRNPPCARPVRRRGPAGHLSGDRTTVASVTVFGAVGDLAVSQPERAVAAFAAAQWRRPPASPRGSAAAQLTRAPAGPRQHWSIRVASLIPSWLRGSNPPSKGPSPGGSTRGVRRAASSSEVDGGCRRAGEESACSPVTGIVVVFGRREQRPPSPSSEESYWPALPRRRGIATARHSRWHDHGRGLGLRGDHPPTPRWR